MSSASSHNQRTNDDTNGQSSARSSSTQQSSRPSHPNSNYNNGSQNMNNGSDYSDLFSRRDDRRPVAASNEFRDRGRERTSNGPTDDGNKRKFNDDGDNAFGSRRPKQPRSDRTQEYPQQPRYNRDQQDWNPRDQHYPQQPRSNNRFPQYPQQPRSSYHPQSSYSQQPPRPRDRYEGNIARSRDHQQYQSPRVERYSPHNQRESGSSTSHNESTTTQPKAPVTKESIESSIKKLEENLSKLEDVQSIDEIKVIDSRWGVKPKGFEQVSAPRAKLSGLFPLPGYPRPVDFTKLEGLVKDRLSNTNDILNETSKIDPCDSRAAKTLIICNIEEINYLKIVEFFNDYLKMIDFEQSSSNNIHNKKKLKDDKTLIIEFNNNECATIINSLNGTDLLFNAYKNDDIPRKEINDKYKLQILRPREYVVQDEPTESDEINEVVKDSPRKISVLITPNITNDQALEEFEKIAPLQGFHYYRQKGTKEPLGLVEIEFKEQLPNIIDLLKNISFVNDAFYACVNPDTPIQKGPINHNTLLKLVKNEIVQPRKSSNVIQLINVVSSKDLIDDSNFKFINEDIKLEAKKFGNIKSMKIPRPANDFTPGLQQFDVPGLGKIFIEFEDVETALKAIMELSGRSYNDRIVLASYFDEQDYKMGLF
ncbi:uncharacterized protein KGF55_005640 [Candida pseudojiufengensis]|uniref:uncharacterized protein n=1 Tax=Candida pseudojiufengensis TaxID=497109 RepID=UPI002224E088|nr:uncharacterized protein KGF55_005640 [Candida pseudojiufengensis]KAI5958986.1 hypothetical protein KGF55_005640 [Candida pseudojiufengensis]